MLQFDGIDWKVSKLGEQALLLEPQVDSGHLDYIHRLYRCIESDNATLITDVVPAYKSIAVFYSSSKTEMIEYLKQVKWSSVNKKEIKVFEVEVDYSQGLDWKRVCDQTKLSRSEIIERHSKPVYKVAMIGFIPGFIFLAGLEPGLTVSRLGNPRTKIPAGSIGIGGNQTGIYSLESPGGWNIIGSSNHQFFDTEKDPPILISPGDKLKFKSIGD